MMINQLNECQLEKDELFHVHVKGMTKRQMNSFIAHKIHLHGNISFMGGDEIEINFNNLKNFIQSIHYSYKNMQNVEPTLGTH